MTNATEAKYYPPNTKPQMCSPDQMAIDDFVRIGGEFFRVEDMRAMGGSSSRVLILEHYGPWVMTSKREIYRPI
ncbi:hypothetical protein [Streptomyces lasiicapitis]|uniref:hypothetical protein n=1 Tax=Streptomyces lasiicapitis TaxID=1923961 RepID=UPI003650B96F